MAYKKSTHLICTKPFEHFEVLGTSNAYPTFICCRGWLPKPTGDLTYQSPQEAWHSEEAVKIRRSVTDGSFKYCKREFCPHLNSISGPVKYVDESELAKYQTMVEDGNIQPKQLNCGYDTSCNLSCPSCRRELMMAKGEEREMIAKLGTSLLDSFGPHLEYIYMTGSGDPFASKHFLGILTGVDDPLKKYPQLKLHLHTNAQLFTPDVWRKMNSSKNRIGIMHVSIDAASETTYHENRRPGHWKTLLENMEFISSLRRADHIGYLIISFVVQKNNYNEMTDL